MRTKHSKNILQAPARRLKSVCIGLFLGLGTVFVAEAQLEFYSGIEEQWLDVGIGGAHSNEFSEGWVDTVIPIWVWDEVALGLHGRYAGGEINRHDTALGLIVGIWMDRLDSLLSLSGYWDYHEILGDEYDEGVVGGELYSPIGEFRIFGHITSGSVVKNHLSGPDPVALHRLGNLLGSGEGIELEYGGDLPWWALPGRGRLFIGYQSWNRDANQIEGVAARGQWVLNDQVSLQARYFDDERILGGKSHWRFEVAFRFPLGSRELDMSGGEEGDRPKLLRRPARITWPVLGRGQLIHLHTGQPMQLVDIPQ